MRSHIYSPDKTPLVWLEEIVNNRIGRFLGPFIVLYHDEWYKIIVIDQNGVIKRYSCFSNKIFSKKALHDTVADQGIEESHKKVHYVIKNH